MSSSPIADLSYRNYDGPLEPLNHRWWSIAKSTMRIGFKKKSAWWCSIASAWYFYAMIFVIFITDKAAEAAGNAPQMQTMTSFFGRVRWSDQFLHGLQYGQILYFIVALILGAGSIANDTRANALLVYLSKPISKRDYVFGKWFGIFLPLLTIMAAPVLLFYLYGLMSFRDKGFVSQDPLLIFKLFAIMPFAAAFYASLALGISSMFNQGRTAGAVFGGMYFLSNFFTVLMTVAYFGMSGEFSRRGHRPSAPQGALDTVMYLAHSSIDGISNSFTQAVLGRATTAPFNIPVMRGPISTPAPPLLFGLGIGLFVIMISIGLAWRRVRAVEIVG
ncbi:MAG: ABC transporter permease subunit [Fimbriimonadaceae bacterium]